jgi:hypothetical protein
MSILLNGNTSHELTRDELDALDSEDASWMDGREPKNPLDLNSTFDAVDRAVRRGRRDRKALDRLVTVYQIDDWGFRDRVAALTLNEVERLMFKSKS